MNRAGGLYSGSILPTDRIYTGGTSNTLTLLNSDVGKQHFKGNEKGSKSKSLLHLNEKHPILHFLLFF